MILTTLLDPSTTLISGPLTDLVRPALDSVDVMSMAKRQMNAGRATCFETRPGPAQNRRENDDDDDERVRRQPDAEFDRLNALPPSQASNRSDSGLSAMASASATSVTSLGSFQVR